MMRVTFTRLDGKRFAQDMMTLVRKACDLTAAQVPLDQTRRIALRIGPEGETQKANAPATEAEKRRRLGESTPLRDSGTLEDPALYKWKRERGGTWRISLPVNRVAVVQRLLTLGYKYWGWTEELRAFLAEAINRVVETLRKNVGVYKVD